MAVGRRQLQPAAGFLRVGLDPFAALVALGQAELGVRVLLGGRQAEPAQGLLGLLGADFPAQADLSVREIRVFVAAFRGAAHPFGGEGLVNRRAEAEQVVDGAFKHRLGVAGFGTFHRIGEKRRLLGRGGALRSVRRLRRLGAQGHVEQEQQEPETGAHIIIETSILAGGRVVGKGRPAPGHRH